MTCSTDPERDICCALCQEPWGRAEPCCTVTLSPRKTHCTECCLGDLHGQDIDGGESPEEP